MFYRHLESMRHRVREVKRHQRLLPPSPSKGRIGAALVMGLLALLAGVVIPLWLMTSGPYGESKAAARVLLAVSVTACVVLYWQLHLIAAPATGGT